MIEALVTEGGEVDQMDLIHLSGNSASKMSWVCSGGGCSPIPELLQHSGGVYPPLQEISTAAAAAAGCGYPPPLLLLWGRLTPSHDLGAAP